MFWLKESSDDGFSTGDADYHYDLYAEWDSEYISNMLRGLSTDNIWDEYGDMDNPEEAIGEDWWLYTIDGGSVRLVYHSDGYEFNATIIDESPQAEKVKKYIEHFLYESQDGLELMDDLESKMGEKNKLIQESKDDDFSYGDMERFDESMEDGFFTGDIDTTLKFEYETYENGEIITSYISDVPGLEDNQEIKWEMYWSDGNGKWEYYLDLLEGGFPVRGGELHIGSNITSGAVAAKVLEEGYYIAYRYFSESRFTMEHFDGVRDRLIEELDQYMEENYPAYRE
jgi:hypothetical protein